MSTDLDASFNEQFTKINMKLKRRFMRKPNLAECTKEFLALAVRCEYSEQPTFAGHAYVGAAKCAASAGDILDEAGHYMTAGKQYMKAEKKLYALKFHSPDRENLEAAIGCFTTAFNKYPEGSQMRATIYLSLASDLTSLDHKEEAIHYYTQALELCKSVAMKHNCHFGKLEAEIECGKYEEAWLTANAMATTDGPYNLKGYSVTDIANIQTYRILLTLLRKDYTYEKPMSLKELFTDLLNDNESELMPFQPTLKLKLQSIISCASSGDVFSLTAVASDAMCFLTKHQADVLEAVVRKERAKHLSIT